MTTRCGHAWSVRAALSIPLVILGSTALAAEPPPLDPMEDAPAAADAEPPPLDAAPATSAMIPRRRRQPREPYRADDVSPFARNELALTGTVVTGGAYFITLFALAPQGFPNHGWPMMIPVAGPWITLAIREDIPGVSNEDSKRGFIAADGIVQGAGVVMLIIGQLLPVTDPMHPQGPSLSVAPTLAPEGTGVRAWGTF